MLLKVSVVITGIAIGLLVLYGADVASSMGVDGEKIDDAFSTMLIFKIKY